MKKLWLPESMKGSIMKSVKVIWASVLGSVVLAAGLVACGGGSDPVLVATSDVNVKLASTNGGAFVGTTLSFPSGVPDFGTAGTTTLSIGGSTTSTTQTATISADGKTASGDMGYGSCFFVIKTSNFADNSALAVGKTVVVNPCEMKVTTAGLVANGGEQLTRVSMTLGTQLGAGSIKITITPDGIVKSGSSQLANLSLTPATGAGS
ncbi:MAG: hypothetical protein KF796_18175 [Ramlibacter sp.]|nr:hypothetical protein [Ramlibacter sp.]